MGVPKSLTLKLYLGLCLRLSTVAYASTTYLLNIASVPYPGIKDRLYKKPL
jgi:hypothetical protein